MHFHAADLKFLMAVKRRRKTGRLQNNDIKDELNIDSKQNKIQKKRETEVLILTLDCLLEDAYMNQLDIDFWIAEEACTITGLPFRTWKMYKKTPEVKSKEIKLFKEKTSRCLTLDLEISKDKLQSLLSAVYEKGR